MARRRFIADNMDLLQGFSADLLPLMLQVHGGTVTAQACARALPCAVPGGVFPLPVLPL